MILENFIPCANTFSRFLSRKDRRIGTVTLDGRHSYAGFLEFQPEIKGDKRKKDVELNNLSKYLALSGLQRRSR